MKKQALFLGLTATLHVFLFLPLAMYLFFGALIELPYQVVHLTAIAAAGFGAAILTRMVESDEELPPWLVNLLLVSAGYVLLRKLLAAFGVNLGYNKFMLFLHRAEDWAQIITALSVLRFFKPRLMLFFGLLAFAWQFNAVGIVLPFALNVPKVWLNLVSLIVAVWIARAFSVGDDTAADRVKNPSYLWFFAGAGTFMMLMEREDFWLRTWQENLVRFAFLLSFVLLVDKIESDELEPKAAGLGAGYGTLIPIFIALFLVVSAVFEINDVVQGWLPWSWGDGSQFWVPLIACGAVAFAIMKYLDVGQRLPEYGLGRRLVIWCAILYGVAILAGGSIFGGLPNDGGALDFLVIFIYFAVMVVPIMTLALILGGTGLLRIFFSLDARPRE